MTLLRFEKCLLPPPEIIHWNGGKLRVQTCTPTEKVVHYMKNFMALTGFFLLSPLTLVYDYWSQKRVEPVAPPLGSAENARQSLPTKRGFACSLFQTAGLGMPELSAVPGLEGKCDWEEWIKNPAHVKHPEGFNYKDFFTDILSNPTPYIRMLKAHNSTALRFSLEWSVIEPEKGRIDQNAVQLYRNFLQELIKEGITPSVTLSHFVVPKWFYKAGNFQKVENIDAYVDFALNAIQLFPEVKHWWSFNELGVKAFQQMREVYPTDIPEGSCLSKRVHATGIATRNMLIAHCKLHEAVTRLYPQKRLGVTHQWLKFDVASGNWIEQLLRYYLEKMSFRPIYQFFKDGAFSFQVPFMANIHFCVSKEEFAQNKHFLQRLGVQMYPQTFLKMGLNSGQKQPVLPGSFQNSVVTFGATCEADGTLTSFGPRWRVSAVDEILEEAAALGKKLVISEYGSDGIVHESGKEGFVCSRKKQAQYLQQLTERIQSYCQRKKVKLKGLFVWSDLIGQMEWDRGRQCSLAMVDPVKNEKREMIGFTPTAASKYIAKAFHG